MCPSESNAPFNVPAHRIIFEHYGMAAMIVCTPKYSSESYISIWNAPMVALVVRYTEKKKDSLDLQSFLR